MEGSAVAKLLAAVLVKRIMADFPLACMRSSGRFCLLLSRSAAGYHTVLPTASTRVAAPARFDALRDR
jgi:hypothetical protein